MIEPTSQAAVAAAQAIDLPSAIEVFRYHAGWCTKLTGETIALSAPEQDFHTFTTREPVGVVVAQVVGVGFREGRQRAEDGGLVAVHVGERGDRGPPASGAGATAGRTHEGDRTSR